MSERASRSPELRLPERSIVPELARRVERAGGRVVVVGGWVRDQLCGTDSNDLDLEVFGLTPTSISALLAPLGFTSPVGRQFAVWRQTREAVDVALPRAGAALFSASDPNSLEIAFREASRHRDLTINAIGWDPLVDPTWAGLIDPWQGRSDVESRTLRAVDDKTFGSDPLRVLRVARLSARFEAEIDPKLLEICRNQELHGLPAERITTELRRILGESKRPSRAFDFLDRVEQLQIFPMLAALRGVPQDPRFHPEGDVYTHTAMVIDRASELAMGLSAEDREVLLFAALCHDLGKPETTTVDEGKIRSLGHETRSAVRTREWLETLTLPERLVRRIETLVRHHLAPGQLVAQEATARAYRKLARRLSEGGVGIVDLERLARADHLGRTTAEARAGRFDAGRRFLEAATAALVREGVRPDVVTASDWLARGVDPGPRLGQLLECCREIQDETGLDEADRIMQRALAIEGQSGSTRDPGLVAVLARGRGSREAP